MEEKEIKKVYAVIGKTKETMELTPANLLPIDEPIKYPKTNEYYLNGNKNWSRVPWVFSGGDICAVGNNNEGGVRIRRLLYLEGLVNATKNINFNKNIVVNNYGLLGWEDKPKINREVLVTFCKATQTGTDPPSATVNEDYKINDGQLYFEGHYYHEGAYLITIRSHSITLSDYAIEINLEERAIGAYVDIIPEQVKMQVKGLETIMIITSKNGIIKDDVLKHNFLIKLYKK